MHDREVWADIPRHKGYQVSSHGNMRVLDRVVNCSKGKRTIKGKPLKPWIGKTGYPQIGLTNRKRENVHCLVAMAFCDGYMPGLEVNHKDGIRAHNWFTNLEWVTRKENILHSYRELGRVGSSTGKYGRFHPTSKAVIAKNIKTGRLTFFECGINAIKDGAASDSGSISRCCYGVAISHKGHYYRFASEDESKAQKVIDEYGREWEVR